MTREGGYTAKILSASFQNIVLDEHGTDCGTQKTIKVHLTKDNYELFYYRYIKEGNKLILLTPDNIENYLDKIVHMRSPMYCISKQCCNKCSGELYYMLDLKEVGLLSSRLGTSLLNSSLKAFHDMTLKLVDIDIDKYID